MSNRLIICVTEFRVLNTDADETTFGFTAADDYAKEYEDHYNTKEEFFSEYPTKESLTEYVLSLSGFEDIDSSDPENIIGVGSIIVDGY